MKMHSKKALLISSNQPWTSI